MQVRPVDHHCPIPFTCQTVCKPATVQAQYVNHDIYYVNSAIRCISARNIIVAPAAVAYTYTLSIMAQTHCFHRHA